MIRLNPYIGFRDNARKAMEFYKNVFAGNIEIKTFKEFNASGDPSEDNKIMHSVLNADGITFMAADTPDHLEFVPGKNISMSLSGDDEKTLRRYWNRLSEGAKIGQPLEVAPWGDAFGMLTDKFGIIWLVNITGAKK